MMTNPVNIGNAVG